MKTDKVSFTSKINFVDRETFYKLCTGKFINFSNPETSIVKADSFYMESVRTCSAGGIKNSKTGEAAGLHSYDKEQYSAPVEKVVSDLFSKVENPDGALLLGGKNLSFNAYNSMRRFWYLKEAFLKRIKNVTVFEEHAFPDSESNLCYLNDCDTWLINSEYTDYRSIRPVNKCVSSIEELLRFFRKVELAQGDTLFINGKEVEILNQR